MNKALRAWLLEWPRQPLALAQCEVVEVVGEPEVHRVPCGPAWCRSLLYWRERFLPLAAPTHRDGLTIVVVAYQTAPRTPLQYAALAVDGTPRQFDVPPDADCDPPADGVFHPSLLRASFRMEERTVVVPNLNVLFAPGEAAA